MTVHARLGVAVIAVAAVGALLVAVSRSRPALVPTVRVFMRLCAATTAVEAGVGVVLLATGHRPAQVIHYFYGAATVLGIPLAEVLGRRASPRHDHLYLLAGAISTALLGFRALATGAL